MTVSLDVSAWYSSSGVEISGTSQSLIALARLLERPEDAPVVMLRARGSGAVHIDVQGHIRGGAEQLGVLAQHIAFFATHGDPDDPLDHAHVEYYETPPDWTHYLAPSAEPLILSFHRKPR
jgi:hypothetical protein